MQQILNKLKLSVVTSVVQHIEQLSLTRLPLSTFSSSRLPSENVNINNVNIEYDSCKSTSPSITRQKIRKEKSHWNAHLSRDLSLSEALSRSGHVYNINSSIQKKKNPSLNPLSSGARCLRNFSTVYGNHHLVHPSASAQDLSQHSRNLWNLIPSKRFGEYAVLLTLGQVCGPHQVPSRIICPSYAESGRPPQGPRGPEVKAEGQVDAMRDSCRIARSILNAVGENIKAGMTTEEIDELVHSRIIESGAYPSPLNYHGFPKSVCTSVNNVACHGVPSNRNLLNGDIISVDVTVFYNGYHGDCCETYLIGDVDKLGRHLVEAARRCRDEAIAICRPGVPFSDIGAKVEEIALQEKVTVVPAFVGHGIGQYFHGPPDIYHCYNDYPGTMEDGMTFTIEPIVAQGLEEITIYEDGWTAVMADNGRAAQFEHTVLITDKGHEILTDYY